MTDTATVPPKARRKAQEPANPAAAASTAEAEAAAFHALAQAAEQLAGKAEAAVRVVLRREADTLEGKADRARERAASLYDQAAARLRS